MNNLKYSKKSLYNYSNYSKENKLKSSEDEHKINDSNNFYEYDNNKENENDGYLENIIESFNFRDI